MDVDEIFSKIGEYGRYQKLITILLTFPLTMASSFVTFNQLFMTETPDHWCRVSELECIQNSTMRRFLSIPLTENGFEKCSRYRVNWSEIDVNNLNFPDKEWPIEPCVQGWEYDTSEITSSVVIDYNLVCDSSLYPTIGLVFLNIGGPIGVFLFGYINDRLGRKITLIFCLGTSILSNFSSAFSPNLIFWLLSRCVVGFTVPALYHIAFIYTLEIIGSNYRSFFTLMTGVFFAISNMSLAGISYAVPDWKYMSIITSAPFTLCFVTLWFVPESPRWLLVNNKPEEAVKVFKKIAKINNTVFPKSYLDSTELNLLTNEDKTKQKSKVLDLFKTPNMRIKTILISFIWFVAEVVYIGLSYYGPALGDDSHMSFFLSSLVEIPASFLCWCVMDKYGRKFPLVVLLMLSGISCILTVVLPQDANLFILILYLMSKFAIAVAFLILFTYAGELFPTNVRGMGLAFAAYICGIGRIFLPFVTDLGSDVLVLPLVILGSMCVLGGIFTLKLPETLHQPLPQTVEEGEEFGKDVSWFECCKSS